MATVVITPDVLTNKGNEATWTPCVTADKFVFPNTGLQILLAKNAGGSSRNVTIERYKKYDEDNPTDRVVSVSAGAIALIGPFDPLTYNGLAGDELGRVVFSGSHTDLSFYVVSSA